MIGINKLQERADIVRKNKFAEKVEVILRDEAQEKAETQSYKDLCEEEAYTIFLRLRIIKFYRDFMR